MTETERAEMIEEIIDYIMILKHTESDADASISILDIKEMDWVQGVHEPILK